MNAEASFVVCIDSCEYPASLERRKIYRILHDADAEQHGMVRVIDESGEDYLYPKSCFVAIDLPQPAADAILGAS